MSDQKPVDKMNRDELNKYGKFLGINDADNEEKYNTKADLVAAIKEAEPKDQTPPAIDSADDSSDDSGVEPAPGANDEPEEAEEEVEETVNPSEFGRFGVHETKEEAGMGYKMDKDGHTVDIFDEKTPHTHLKNVAGVMVPLSQDSYENKTDAQIIEKLKELGKL